MTQSNLETLSDHVSEAHARIQQDFADINPVVGINQGMRKVGIAADVMTIDCLKTGKRIIMVLHDQQPDILQYQFSFKAQDPDEDFQTLLFNETSIQTLYDWMKDYFSINKN